eukprot:gb/GECG01002205.1/.p1 GENE.gb/GECG01002205.1/~~gb/GECG01002205.1/.p1  ORF type:complete len:528 (+),score=64.81 gb/GECG01002205.1/:1-1584(+)
MEGFSEYRLSQGSSMSETLLRSQRQRQQRNREKRQSREGDDSISRGLRSSQLQQQQQQQSQSGKKKRKGNETSRGVEVKAKRSNDDEYAWERAYERSWEAVEEDEHGRLRAHEFIRSQHQRDSMYGGGARRRRMESEYGITTAIRRGMIRFVVIVLDLSDAMSATDLMPSRLSVVLSNLKDFLREFSDQNPLAQMCLVTTSDARASRATTMSANPAQITRYLSRLENALETEGEMTLQTALDISYSTLSLMPDYGNREIIVIHGALATCDSGNVFDTIQNLVKSRTRVSVISLSGEMYIARKVTEETNGLFGVAESVEHFRDLLFQHIKPPPKTSREASERVTMVRMGFPHILSESTIIDGDGIKRERGYQCPRCYCFTGEIPSACSVCKLNLVSSAHLARSYHHLFPVAPFVELKSNTDFKDIAGSGGSTKSDITEGPNNYGAYDKEVNDAVVKGAYGSARSTGSTLNDRSDDQPTFSSSAWFCAGCMRKLEEYESRFVCPESHNTYCSECDIFIHESLHNSPGEV